MDRAPEQTNASPTGLGTVRRPPYPLAGVVSGYYEFEDEQDDDGTLDKTTVEAIRRGTLSIPDVDVAERLVDQVAGLMVAVATGGSRIDDVKAQYAREYKALSAVLKRLGIKNPNSHAYLWTWYGKWTSDDTLSGGWAPRRTYIAEMYSPVREALEASTDSDRDVATGADDSPTGWADVDAKLGTLRRRVRDMDDTPDDARAVGPQCVSVLEALGRAAFDLERHLPAEEDAPHPNDAKARLGHFLTAVAGEEIKKGERFEHVRTLVRAAWRQAQSVKHRDNPSRTDAGVAADSVALLVAIVRRLADEDRPPKQPPPDYDIPW